MSLNKQARRRDTLVGIAMLIMASAILCAVIWSGFGYQGTGYYAL